MENWRTVISNYLFGQYNFVKTMYFNTRWNNLSKIWTDCQKIVRLKRFSFVEAMNLVFNHLMGKQLDLNQLKIYSLAVSESDFLTSFNVFFCCKQDNNKWMSEKNTVLFSYTFYVWISVQNQKSSMRMFKLTAVTNSLHVGKWVCDKTHFSIKSYW